MMAKPLFTSDLTPLDPRHTFVKTTEQVSASRFTLLPSNGTCAQGSDEKPGGIITPPGISGFRGAGFRFFAATDYAGGY